MIVPCTTPAPSSVFRLGGEASAAYVHIAYAVNISFGYPTGTVFTNIVDASAAVGPMNLIAEQYVLYALGVAANGTHITPVVATASAFLAHANSTTELCVILGVYDGRAQLALPSPLPYPTPDGTTITASGHNVWSISGGGSWAFQWVTKTGNYTITGTDSGIEVDASAGDVTITLPTAVGVQRCFAIKRKDSSASYVVTVATTSAQTIDGYATLAIRTAGHVYLIGSDGANWAIVSGYYPNPLTAKGDVAVGDANAMPTRVGVGSDGQALTARASATDGVDYEAPTLSHAQAALAANVTMTTTNTWYDGPTISLTAGTWAITASVTIYNSGGAQHVLARIWDGTTSYASGWTVVGAASWAVVIALSCIVTVGSTTTYRLAGLSWGGGAIMLASVAYPPGGAWAGVGNNASTISAVRIG